MKKIPNGYEIYSKVWVDKMINENETLKKELKELIELDEAKTELISALTDKLRECVEHYTSK